jgi:hypothetical protein
MISLSEPCSVKSEVHENKIRRFRNLILRCEIIKAYKVNNVQFAAHLRLKFLLGQIQTMLSL